MPSIAAFLRGITPRPNAAPVPLRITLARRLVETQAAPFVRTGEVFHDAASARDELGLLPAAQGPTVVRVRVQGGTAEERKALKGDWLVDPDAPQRIVRLPMPRWTYEEEAREWTRARPWLEAWETCADACWMLDAAGCTDVDHRLIVLAACAFARTVLHLVPAGEEIHLRALEAAERWTRGEASHDDVESATDAVRAANAGAAFASAAASAVYAASAAASAVYAASAAASAPYAVSAAVSDHTDWSNSSSAAAYYAAIAATDAAASTATCTRPVSESARTMSMARNADLVRREIPTLTVLRAVAKPA